MKKLFYGLAAACLAVPVLSHAQTTGYTTVTAASLKMAGSKISQGTVTFTPVNRMGVPIAFADGSGSQNGPMAFGCTISAGAINGMIQDDGTTSGTCQVPDASQTVPANIEYQIVVSDTSIGLRTSGKAYTLQAVVGVSGATWALDHYGPAADTTNVQAVQASIGTTVPASCTAPAIFTDSADASLYTCVAGSFVPVSGVGGVSVSAAAIKTALGSTTYDAFGAASAALATGTSASNQAAALSPLDYGLVCDAVETVHATNGLPQYSTVTGTDNTTALANVFAAARVTPAATLIAEADAGSAQHRTVRFPLGCRFAAATFPTINDPIQIEGNHSRAYITATSGNGPVFTSINSGDVSGIANASLRDMEITYAGATGTSAGTCAGFISGTQNSESNVGCYGFRIGHVRAGVEYSSFTNLRGAYNGIGMLCTAASYANYPTPAAISATGTTSINNMTRDLVIRNNTINFVGNGCNSETVDNATFGFGKAADIILGAIDFPFISAATVSGGSCTANSAVPVTFADSADNVIPAQGILITDGNGNPTSIDVYNGGRGYVLANTTVSVPTTGAASCTTAPTITPTITALTGLLPFSGAANAGQAQLSFEHLVLENESHDATGVSNHPATGYQVILGPTTSTTHIDHVITSLGDAVPYGDYGRYLRNEGLDNETSDTIYSANTDPVTGVNCPYTTVPGHVLEHHENAQAGDPESMVCNTSGMVDTSYDVVLDGYQVNSGGTVWLRRSHGNSTTGSYGYNADSEPADESDEPGDTVKRYSRTPSGSIAWGSGSATADTSLKRSDVGQMTATGVWNFPAVGLATNTPPNYYTYPANTLSNGYPVKGSIWADDQYLYRVNSTSHIVRIPWSAMNNDTASAAGTTQ